MTHTLSEDCPSWENSCGFKLETTQDFQKDNSFSFKIQSFEMNCGLGTHIDAPAHCFKNLFSIESIPMSYLINKGIVIDISYRCSEDNHLTQDDILKFENIHGNICENSCVLINTGWHKKWSYKKDYHNNYKFPFIDPSAAKLLALRKIRILGVDTLSPDRPDSNYPVHEILLSNEILIVENVGNLSLLPSKNFVVTIAPIKLQGATEAPVRMWAQL